MDAWSPAAQPPATTARIDLRHLFAKQISILGSYMGSKHELLKVLALVDRGAPPACRIERTPLREAAQAQTLLETRQHFGKVVLTVCD